MHTSQGHPNDFSLYILYHKIISSLGVYNPQFVIRNSQPIYHMIKKLRNGNSSSIIPKQQLTVHKNGDIPKKLEICMCHRVTQMNFLHIFSYIILLYLQTFKRLLQINQKIHHDLFYNRFFE